MARTTITANIPTNLDTTSGAEDVAEYLEQIAEAIRDNMTSGHTATGWHWDTETAGDTPADILARNLASPHMAGLLETDGGSGARQAYAANGGGYENFYYFVTADGGALAIATVLDEMAAVDFTDEGDSQWHIIGGDVNYENGDLYDDHTGRPITPAYN